MIASDALRSRWWTGSGRVWTGATTIESPVWTPERVDVLHRADRDARVVGVAHHLVLDLFPADEAALDDHLADRAGPEPGPDPLPVGGLGLDDPAAGPAEGERRADDRRQADLAERPLRRRRRARPGRRPRRSTTADTAGRSGRGAPRKRSRSSAISIASSGVPRSRTSCRSSTPARARATARLSAVCPPSAGEQALGSLAGDHGLDRLDGQRLEVDDVGDGRVGHDRRRVRVDEDRPDALGAERPAGLRPGVVELGRLADDDRPRAEDEDPTWPGVTGARRHLPRR